MSAETPRSRSAPDRDPRQASDDPLAELEREVLQVEAEHPAPNAHTSAFEQRANIVPTPRSDGGASTEPISFRPTAPPRAPSTRGGSRQAAISTARTLDGAGRVPAAWSTLRAPRPAAAHPAPGAKLLTGVRAAARKLGQRPA